MCGISGIINLQNRSVNEQALRELTSSLTHRGPDAEGFWFNETKRLGLGHRRLSILDLSSHGAQPMMSDDGNTIMVLNGEIFNFLELRTDLAKEGYVFRSESDTEVVLAAYRQWGLSMLDRFNGMWALAIYDLKTDKMLLSRDRFGIKPLFYYHDQEEFVFASEVRAIQCYLKQKAEVNRKVIDKILHFDRSYDHEAETYIKNVLALKPGHNLIFEHKKATITPWYSLKKRSVPDSFEAQVVEFKALFSDAIKIRMRSDVPVGTCLSGGIDSGSISSYISKMNTEEHNERISNFSHRSFCAAFPGVAFDESEDASFLANTLGLQLDVKIIEPPSVEELEAVMTQTDGPMPAFAFYPIWKLYQYIKSEGITVTLDGQGADEMFGGYYLGFPALKGALEIGDQQWFADLQETYAALHPNGENWIKNELKVLHEGFGKFKWYFVKQKIKKLLAYFKIDLQRSQTYSSYSNSFEQALQDQFFKAPLPFLLNQYDRASMLSGVECRMPFMDYRVVEYVFSLPSQSKVGQGFTKRLLRESVKGVLPEKIRTNRTKTGFNAPTLEWFTNELKDWFLAEINSKAFLENPFFDGPTINREFTAALDKGNLEGFKWKFWSYIHVNRWYQEFQKINQERFLDSLN